MSDLIRRKDVIKGITQLPVKVDNLGYTWMIAGDVLKQIDDIPSAEPERKKGEWSNYKDEHCCSVCKCVVISDCWDDEIRYDYCPYCGAEME